MAPGGGGGTCAGDRPTGSGKTLAAFLWAINQLATGPGRRGQVRVLYISPLRALNNDVRRNLLDPLRELEASVRTGRRDRLRRSMLPSAAATPMLAERRRMISRPPEILITTPESLNLLVSSQSGRRILTAGSKRDTGRDSCRRRRETRRLSHDCRRATHAARRRVSAHCAFRDRRAAGNCRTIRRRLPHSSPARRERRRRKHAAAPLQPRPISQSSALRIESRSSLPSAALPKPDPSHQTFWPVLVERVAAGRLTPEQSTLVFVNNRRLSERLCHLLNESAGRTIAYSHHGAMAREVRALVEQRLKQGKLSMRWSRPARWSWASTSAAWKRCCWFRRRARSMARFSASARAGHSVGATSHARLFPTHSADLLDAAVFAPLVRDQKPQPLRPVNNPLDILAQVCVAMCGVEPWKPDELFAFFRTCDSYHSLTRRAFDLVIQMLQGRYFDARIGVLRPRLAHDDEQGRLIARDGALSLVYTSGGVIPDRGYFNVRIRGSRAVLGQLDEEFVWERRVGDQFRIGMQSWRIERITHNDVEVGPGASTSAGMPFWRGDSEDREFRHLREDWLVPRKRDQKLAANDETTVACASCCATIIV